MGLVVFSKVLFNCVKLEEGNIVSGQAALRDEIPFSSWRYVCEPQLLGEAPKKAWGAYLFRNLRSVLCLSIWRHCLPALFVYGLGAPNFGYPI